MSITSDWPSGQARDIATRAHRAAATNPGPRAEAQLRLVERKAIELAELVDSLDTKAEEAFHDAATAHG